MKTLSVVMIVQAPDDLEPDSLARSLELAASRIVENYGGLVVEFTLQPVTPDHEPDYPIPA